MLPIVVAGGFGLCWFRTRFPGFQAHPAVPRSRLPWRPPRRLPGGTKDGVLAIPGVAGGRPSMKETGRIHVDRLEDLFESGSEEVEGWDSTLTFRLTGSSEPVGEGVDEGAVSLQEDDVLSRLGEPPSDAEADDSAADDDCSIFGHNRKSRPEFTGKAAYGSLRRNDPDQVQRV